MVAHVELDELRQVWCGVFAQRGFFFNNFFSANRDFCFCVIFRFDMQHVIVLAQRLEEVKMMKEFFMTEKISVHI